MLFKERESIKRTGKNSQRVQICWKNISIRRVEIYSRGNLPENKVATKKN